MPAYTNETGFPVLAINTSGQAIEVADDGTFQSYNYYADQTMTATTPNPTVKVLPSGFTLEFNLVGIADDSVADVAMPAVVTNLILGQKLAEVYVIPGTGDNIPTAAFSITLTDANGAIPVSNASCAVDAVTMLDGDDEFTNRPIIDTTLTLSCGDIGEDNTAQVIVKTQA